MGVRLSGESHGGGGGGAARFAELALSADQTSNLSVGDHIELNEAGGDLVDAGLVALSTGAGQADGEFTLAAGRYLLTATALVTLSGDSSAFGFRLRTAAGGAVATHTPSGVEPHRTYYRVGDGAFGTTGPSSSLAILLELAAAVTLVLEVSASGASEVKAGTRVVIEELPA